MAALVAMRYNAKMKKFYEQLIAKGKPAKIALVAIMRKIIVCLNAMLKNNKFYEICS
jgi:transposase